MPSKFHYNLAFRSAGKRIYDPINYYWMADGQGKDDLDWPGHDMAVYSGTFSLRELNWTVEWNLDPAMVVVRPAGIGLVPSIYERG